MFEPDRETLNFIETTSVQVNPTRECSHNSKCGHKGTQTLWLVWRVQLCCPDCKEMLPKKSISSDFARVTSGKERIYDNPAETMIYQWFLSNDCALLWGDFAMICHVLPLAYPILGKETLKLYKVETFAQHDRMQPYKLETVSYNTSCPHYKMRFQQAAFSPEKGRKPKRNLV